MTPSPDTQDTEELRRKLRMIVSHASGGHLSKPEDVDRSTNDICVEISRHNNRIWKQAQESALKDRPDSPVTVMREALVEQTLLVDRLCSAVDQAAEDIGHESIDDLLKLIGPQNDRCIEILGGREALARISR